MTGHGEARCRQDALAVTVEVRTVNNRYFKFNARCGEGYGGLESQIEQVVRQHVRRGTVLVDVQISREPSPDDFRLNETVLVSYCRQLQSLYADLQLGEPIRLEGLLALPGVVEQRQRAGGDLEVVWPVVEQAVRQAVDQLTRMRAEEGRAMAVDLQTNSQAIVRELDQIERLAPRVATTYQARLTERLNKLLADQGVQVEAADVVREVGLFAERSDISEEVVRLRSHLEQFGQMMQLEESNGRKLDFLTQEMFRETNTIGSKANDAQIARHVIEIKAAIERMREMVQNVE